MVIYAPTPSRYFADAVESSMSHLPPLPSSTYFAHDAITPTERGPYPAHDDKDASSEANLAKTSTEDENGESESTPTRDDARTPTQKDTLKTDASHIQALLDDASSLLSTLPPSDQRAGLDAAPAIASSTRNHDAQGYLREESYARIFQEYEEAEKRAEEAQRALKGWLRQAKERAKQDDAAMAQKIEDYELQVALSLSLMDAGEHKVEENGSGVQKGMEAEEVAELDATTQQAEADEKIDKDLERRGVKLTAEDEEEEDETMPGLCAEVVVDSRLDPLSEQWDADFWLQTRSGAGSTRPQLPTAPSAKEFRAPSPGSLHADEDKEAGSVTLKSLSAMLARERERMSMSSLPTPIPGAESLIVTGGPPSSLPEKVALEVNVEAKLRVDDQEVKTTTTEIEKFEEFLRIAISVLPRRRWDKETERARKRFKKARSIVLSLPRMQVHLGEDVSQRLHNCYLRATSDRKKDALQTSTERLRTSWTATKMIYLLQ
ncbi:hypothetical protein OF83DRAFT_81597 [Amylostereum chailletii]|nr:hypothetical protein OF83DRAFT_81597 [Amylostereum chailletii]